MQQQPTSLELYLPVLVLFVIFYFFIIRPQSKKLKTQELFLAQLKRGDEVITSSGLLGVVDGLTDQLVTLEIANNVKIKVLRKQVIGLATNILNASKASESTGKKG